MVLIWFLSTAVREDSSAFCFPSYGHSKQKNPTASRMPTVGNERISGRLAGFNPLSLRRRQASDHRRSLRQPIRHP